MRAATRYIFSQVFILSEEPQCDGIFQQRNINSLSVLSVSALLARKTCKDVANGSFPFSLLLTSRVASEKSLSFGRKEERQGKKKKRKGNPPNRGILDQRLVPEGNHIFREETTASPFFSYLPWAIVTAASSSPSSAVSLPSLLSPSSSGKSPRTYRRVFPAVFLRHILAQWQRLSSGSYSGLIMHKTQPVSARRLSSRTNPYGGEFETVV